MNAASKTRLDPRRFLRRCGLFLAPFGAYFAIVFAVDARGEFGTHWLPPSVDNARFSKPSLFERYNHGSPVEGLIVGSSRSMQLPPAVFRTETQMRFFNFAVNDGNAEDFAAVYRWALAHAPGIRAIVIGIDPHTLFEGPISNDLLHNEDLYSAYLGRPVPLGQRLAHHLDLWASAFSRPYLEATAYSIAIQLLPNRVPPATYEDPDGLLRPAKLEKTVAAGQFRLDAVLPSSIRTNVGYIERAGALSKERKDALEGVVRDARARGMAVSLWMTTLHPTVVEHLRAETRYDQLADTTLEVLREWGTRYGAFVHDFRSPDRFGGDPQGFYDGAHMDPHNAALVAKALAADLARTVEPKAPSASR